MQPVRNPFFTCLTTSSVSFYSATNTLHSDNPFLKPLPNPHSRRSSDMSSIAPSQSASQIALMGGDGTPSYTPFSSPGSSQAHGSSMVHGSGSASRPVSDAGGAHEYVLAIPPAHSISEHLLPPSKMMVEEVEAEEGGGSSEGESEEDEGGLEVHENKPFAFVANGKHSTPPPPPPAPRHREEEQPRRIDTLPPFL